MKTPAELSYTSHDEWVRRDGSTWTIGITDFAQDALGDLVHVELPAVGKVVAKGDVVCEIESVKAVAEVYAPASGTISAVNAALSDDASALNKDPYGCWIYQLTGVSESGAELMNATTYAAQH